MEERAGGYGTVYFQQRNSAEMPASVSLTGRRWTGQAPKRSNKLQCH
jgi:hypothetical protein